MAAAKASGRHPEVMAISASSILTPGLRKPGSSRNSAVNTVAVFSNADQLVVANRDSGPIAPVGTGVRADHLPRNDRSATAVSNSAAIASWERPPVNLSHA